MLGNKEILILTYVSGILARPIEAEIVNTPLNGSVTFMKDTEVYVSSDFWRLVIHFGFTTFEEAIATLRLGVSAIQEIANRTSYEEVMTIIRTDGSEREVVARHVAVVGELLHIQLALESLESKLGDLKEFLPKADRSRGLFNAVGLILKVLFGTLTLTDLDEFSRHC